MDCNGSFDICRKTFYQKKRKMIVKQVKIATLQSIKIKPCIGKEALMK